MALIGIVIGIGAGVGCRKRSVVKCSVLCWEQTQKRDRIGAGRGRNVAITCIFNIIIVLIVGIVGVMTSSNKWTSPTFIRLLSKLADPPFRYSSCRLLFIGL